MAIKSSSSIIPIAPLFALTLLPLISGCNGLASQSRANPRFVANYHPTFGANDTTKNCKITRERYDTRDGTINLNCFQFPGAKEGDNTAYELASGYVSQPKPDSKSPASNKKSNAKSAPKPEATPIADTAVKAQPSAPDEASTRLYRNRLASIIIGQADANCSHILGKLTSDEATVNTALSTITTGLSAASTVVSGTLAKSILSGVASLSSGSQTNINLYVFRNQIGPVIVHAINLERKTTLDTIRGRFSATTAEWPIDLAIRDINAYNQQCSLYHGFEILLASTEKAQNLTDYQTALFNASNVPKIKEEIEDLRTRKAKDSNNFRSEDQSRLDLLESKYTSIITGTPAPK